jgi:hypothetical protein
MHIFAVSSTPNQPNKNGFWLVCTQRVPYMYLYLSIHHLHISTVSTTPNQPNKNEFWLVCTQQVLYMYLVLMRTRYEYFTIFGVSILHRRTLILMFHLQERYLNFGKACNVWHLNMFWSILYFIWYLSQMDQKPPFIILPNHLGKSLHPYIIHKSQKFKNTLKH